LWPSLPVFSPRGFRFRLGARCWHFPLAWILPISSGSFPITGDVLHDDRNAPVRRVQRILSVAQALVRKATHLRDLVAAQSRLLHQSPRRVRPIRREFPVAVAALAAIRFRVRVSLDRNLVGSFSQFRRQQRRNFLPALVECGTSAIEERSFPRFQELDAQSFLRHRDLNIVFQLGEVVDALDTLLQLLFELRHVLLDRLQLLARPGQAASGFLPGSAGIFEVPADRHLNRLTAVHQPQHDEQRHHGRDEVGIGNLPRTAVMAAMAAFFPDDDDGWCRHDGAYPAAAPVAAASGVASSGAPAAAFASSLAPRQASSTTLNPGRTCPGTVRRPISTAIIGATPFKKAIMITRNTSKNACSSSAILPIRDASGPTNP